MLTLGDLSDRLASANWDAKREYGCVCHDVECNTCGGKLQSRKCDCLPIDCITLDSYIDLTNPRRDTMTFTLYWTREDGQGDYNMGTYPTKEAAEAAIPEAKAELIRECPGPQVETNEEFTKCRDEIEAGNWSVN
jgi:hypothetical protein